MEFLRRIGRSLRDWFEEKREDWRCDFGHSGSHECLFSTYHPVMHCKKCDRTWLSTGPN